jgi:hypothetical protein
MANGRYVEKEHADREDKRRQAERTLPSGDGTESGGFGHVNSSWPGATIGREYITDMRI